MTFRCQAVLQCIQLNGKNVMRDNVLFRQSTQYGECEVARNKTKSNSFIYYSQIKTYINVLNNKKKNGI